MKTLISSFLNTSKSEADTSHHTSEDWTGLDWTGSEITNISSKTNGVVFNLDETIEEGADPDIFRLNILKRLSNNDMHSPGKKVLCTSKSEI